jgi:hypothetical protein
MGASRSGGNDHPFMGGFPHGMGRMAMRQICQSMPPGSPNWASLHDRQPLHHICWVTQRATYEATRHFRFAPERKRDDDAHTHVRKRVFQRPQKLVTVIPLRQ